MVILRKSYNIPLLEQVCNVFDRIQFLICDILTELNLLSEVCITVKKYVEALAMFIQHRSLKFTPPLNASDFEERASVTAALGEPNRNCEVQNGLHSDLIQKIVIVLIHLEAFKFSDVSLS